MRLSRLNYIETHGVIKIISNGDDSFPTYELDAGVPQQVTYTNPKYDPELYHPFADPVEAIYGDVGAYTGIFREVPVLGLGHAWRIGFNYSGKTNNANQGLYIRLTNPLSGFERRSLLVLPAGETSNENLACYILAYADANSLAAPLGTGVGGYQLFIFSTSGTVTVAIHDVTRFTWQGGLSYRTF